MDCGRKGMYHSFICMISFTKHQDIQIFLVPDTYCKIDQMKFSHAHMLVSIHTFLTALDGDGEDSMRTGTVFIHVGGTDRP